MVSNWVLFVLIFCVFEVDDFICTCAPIDFADDSFFLCFHDLYKYVVPHEGVKMCQLYVMVDFSLLDCEGGTVPVYVRLCLLHPI